MFVTQPRAALLARVFVDRWVDGGIMSRWKILTIWTLSRLTEMAFGSILLLTIGHYLDDGNFHRYDLSHYVQAFGLIGLGYLVSGFFIISLYFSFLFGDRIIKLSLFNLASFSVVSVLAALMGMSFEAGLVVYVVQGALIVFSSLLFGAAFSAAGSH